MNYNYPPRNNFQNSYQNIKETSHQKLIQDLNFSHNTFFVLLSTLESITLSYLGNLKSQFKNKMFKSYDKVDYSGKTINELKSQLQTHILLFQTSRKIFDQQHPRNPWQLPSNFNIEDAQSVVTNAIQTFKECKDEQSVRMAFDILQVLNGRFDSLQSQKLDIRVQYSQQQKKANNKEMFRKGVQAAQYMDQEAKKVQNLNNVNQLKAKINPNGVIYSNKFSQDKNIDQRYNGLNQNSVFNPSNGLNQRNEAEAPMDIQNGHIQPQSNKIETNFLFLLFKPNKAVNFPQAGKKFQKKQFQKRNKNADIRICQTEKQLKDSLNLYKHNYRSQPYIILKLVFFDDLYQGYQQIQEVNEKNYSKY